MAGLPGKSVRMQGCYPAPGLSLVICCVFVLPWTALTSGACNSLHGHNGDCMVFDVRP